MSEINLKSIAQFLTHTITYEKLMELCQTQKGASNSIVLCHISPPPPPQPQAKSSSGWGGRLEKVSRDAFFFIGQTCDSEAPAVHVSRRDDRWVFRPTVYKIPVSLAPIVQLDTPWVEALCRLSESTLRPLLHFRSSKDWVNKAINHEIQARLLSFDFHGPYAFFASFDEATAWLVACQWEHWDQQQIAIGERLSHLAKHVDLRVNGMDIMHMHPSAVVARLRSGDLPQSIKGLPIKNHHEGQSSSSAINRANELSLSQQMKSRGGAATYRRRTFRQPVAGKFKTEAEIEASGLWWWRRLDSVNRLEEFAQFSRFWERSAFFYEFRARLHSNSALPTWEGFARLWWDLDRTQRGILYYLWPPDLEGTSSLQARHRRISDIIRFWIKVDFARPLDDVLEDVRQIWQGLEPELIHLWGIGKHKKANADDKSIPSPKNRLDGKWAMLEAIDRQRHLGMQLSPAEKITMKRQIGYYQAACEEAGIPANFANASHTHTVA